MGGGASQQSAAGSEDISVRRIGIKNDYRSMQTPFHSVSTAKIGQEAAKKFQIALKKFCALHEAPQQVYSDVANELVSEVFDKGAVVMKEGDANDKMYFIESGKLNLLKGKFLSTVVEAGEIIAELAVLFEYPAPHTVVAATDCMLWSINRFHFKSLQKTYQKRVLLEQVKKFEHIPEFTENPSLELSHLASAVSTKYFDKGDTLYKCGMASSDIVVIEKGQVKITFPPTKIFDFSPEGILDALNIVKPSGTEVSDEIVLKNENNTEEERSFILTPGYVLGVGILRGRAGNSTGWTWGVTDNLMSQRRTDVEPDVVGGLCPFTATALDGPVQGLGFTVEAFERLCGHCSVSLNKIPKEKQNEMSPIHPAVGEFSEASAERKDITLAGQLRNKFELKNFHHSVIIGKLDHGLVIHAEYQKDGIVENESVVDDGKHHKHGKEKKHHKKKKGKSKEKYQQSEEKKDLYILKFLSKHRLEDANAAEYAVAERKILSVVDHCFICKLYGTIQTPDELVFVLEHLDGGDLWKVIYDKSVQPKMIAAVSKNYPGITLPRRNQSFVQRAASLITSPLQSPTATTSGCPIILVKFYIASVILALAHLHSKNIAFRNISAENIMIDSSGYVRLVGFAMAKQLPCVDQVAVHQKKRRPSGSVVGSAAASHHSTGVNSHMSRTGAGESIARAPTVASDFAGGENGELSGGKSALQIVSKYLTRSTESNVVGDGKPVCQYRTYTICGKAEYLAPEVIASRGHDTRADLWALGVLLFELLCGSTPFFKLPYEPELATLDAPSQMSSYNNTYEDVEENVTTLDIFTNIMKFKTENGYSMRTLLPSHIDPKVSENKKCVDLITNLLKRNPAKRIGSKYGDTNSILSHSFFDGLDLVGLKEKNFLPCVPYVPEPHTTSTIFKNFKEQKLMGIPKLEQNFGGNDHLFENF